MLPYRRVWGVKFFFQNYRDIAPEKPSSKHIESHPWLAADDVQRHGPGDGGEILGGGGCRGAPRGGGVEGPRELVVPEEGVGRATAVAPAHGLLLGGARHRVVLEGGGVAVVGIGAR